VSLSRADLKAMLIDAGVPKSKPWMGKALDVLEDILKGGDEDRLFRLLSKVDPIFKPHAFKVILDLYRMGKRSKWRTGNALTTAWRVGSTSMLQYFGVDGVRDLFREFRSRSRRTEPFWVWRGISPDTPVRGMSWTRHVDLASAYAVARSRSEKTGHVIKTLILPEAILWETHTELLIDPALLGDIFVEDFSENPPLVVGEMPTVSDVVRNKWGRKAFFRKTIGDVTGFLGAETSHMPTGKMPEELKKALE
jgi:hypothetical protein